MGLRDDILDGVAWKTVARVFGQIVAFLFSVLLARLLSPDDFGLFGMILIFTGFAETFGRFGFGAALIQRKEITEAHRSSVFWLNIAVGIILTLLIAASSPLIAWLFGEPKLVMLTLVLSLDFVLTSLVIVQRALHNRGMKFRALAFVEASAITLSGVVGVWMAYAGYGVWSLIAKTMVATAVTALTLWTISDWKPQLRFDLDAIRDLFSFSSHTFGFEVYNYWAGKADDLLVGRYIGAAALGIYTRAYSTMLLPITQITNVLSKVMFPALSKIQDDRDRVRRLYLRAISAIGLVTTPFMMILFVVADSFVVAVYGAQWAPVAPVLRVLCGAGIILPIASTVGWIFKSQGRADWQFRWGLFGTTVTLLATVIGIWVGTMEAVAASYVLAKCVLVPGSYYFAGKLIDMKVREPALALLEIVACSLTAAGLVLLVDWYVTVGWANWPSLLVEVPVGVLSYLALVHVFGVEAYRDVIDQVRHKLNQTRSD